LKETPRVTWESMRQWTRNIFWDFKGGSQIFTVNGVQAEFDARTDRGGDMIRWTYQLEKDWLKRMLDEVNSDDVVFDVGANLGFYSSFLSKILTGGQVVAFEPFPPNVKQLQKNVKHNGNLVDIMDIALSDQTGTVEFTESSTQAIGHATGTIDPDPGSNGYPVSTRRGDDLVEGGRVPQPQLIKIDVEGSEPLVLEGLKNTLSDDRCRTLFCEIHLPKRGDSRPSIREYGSSADEIQAKIRNFGFCLDEVKKRNREFHVIGRK